MAHRYQPQSYAVYPTPHWPEDVKSSFPDEEDDCSSELSSPADMTAVPDSRRHSMVKMEDEFNNTHMWHDRPQSQMAQMRHYSHPTVPTIHTAHHHINRLPEHPYPYGPPPTWPMPHSESSTPIPFHGSFQDPMPIQYASASAKYAYQPQDPPSAVSMSPQSSQGGWASATSSDGAEQRLDTRSPFPGRPMSPMTVLRSDGIRKKNARFEIPRERNLANIDALIMQSTDEAEKKELKQQKRLLRNRQAALDSRQRKKTHTEKLEQEKKAFSTQKQEMEEAIEHIQGQFAQERDQWLHQQQQYEQFIHNLTCERDEAIRTKTLETGELRRQNNALKDFVRDLERQQATRGFSSTNEMTDNFNNDFSFDNLGLEDNFDDYSFIDGEDLKMEGEETPQRQLTPRPPPVSESKPQSKQETLISMNTLYMCLLFGAFFTSTTKDPKSTSAVAGIPDDYRAEAGNVLKALAANQESTSSTLLSSHPQHRPEHHSASASGTESTLPTTISPHELSRMTNPSSSLDRLTTTLTTPSRAQQHAAAFSMSEGSYRHITNPNGFMDSPSPEASSHHASGSHHVAGSHPALGSNHGSMPQQPDRLESILKAFQASRDDVERNMGSKASERSVLLDRAPEGVLRQFREFMAQGDQAEESEE